MAFCRLAYFLACKEIRVCLDRGFSFISCVHRVGGAHARLNVLVY